LAIAYLPSPIVTNEVNLGGIRYLADSQSGQVKPKDLLAK
jgi:hypothetical protein